MDGADETQSYFFKHNSGKKTFQKNSLISSKTNFCILVPLRLWGSCNYAAAAREQRHTHTLPGYHSPAFLSIFPLPFPDQPTDDPPSEAGRGPQEEICGLLFHNWLIAKKNFLTWLFLTSLDGWNIAKKEKKRETKWTDKHPGIYCADSSFYSSLDCFTSMLIKSKCTLNHFCLKVNK